MLGGISGRRADAVVGGQAADHDVVDIVGVQPGSQPLAAVVAADRPLETGVGGLVGAFVEDCVEGQIGDCRIEIGALSARHAVPGPTVDVIGGGAEVGARIDMAITGGDQIVEAAIGASPKLALHEGCDIRGHLGAAGDRQRTALTEVVLNVYDDQCSSHCASRAPASVVLSRC